MSALTPRSSAFPLAWCAERIDRRRLAGWAFYGAAATFGFERLTVVPRLSSSDTCLLIATLLLLPTLWARGPAALREARVLLLGIALIAAGGLLGTLVAPNILSSLAALGSVSLLSAWMVILVAVWRPSRPEIRRSAWCFLASVTVTSLYAIFLDPGDINGRALGLTTHPNQLAMLCVLAAGPATMLVITSRGWRQSAALAIATVLPLGLLFSGSRAGFFGYLAVLLGVVVVAKRRNWMLATVAGPALATVLIAIGAIHLPTPNALQRVFASQDPMVQHSLNYSDIEREELLDVTLARIEHHPLTGEGFEYFFAAHDIYLQLWSSAGLLGLAGCGLIVWQVLAPVRETLLSAEGLDGALPDALLLLGLSLGFGGFLVAGLFQNAFSDRYIWLAPALIVTLKPVLAAAREPRRIGAARAVLTSPPGS